MKKFSISEILIVSHLERAAKRIRFDDRLTVVRGSNDTGKSALLKSIYWTFGAEPGLVHPVWKATAPVCVVRCEVDGVSYKAFRRGDLFCLFDANGIPTATASSVIDYALHVASLLDFGLRLPNRKGVSETPPPAFLFLPFYVDQDRGWTSNWNSFANLGQYAKWKRPTTEYHIGLRDNEYYELATERQGVRSLAEAMRAQLSVLRDLLREMTNSRDVPFFNTNLVDFGKEVEDLLRESTRLQQLENTLKGKLATLHSDRQVLAAQVEVVRRAMLELRKDYDFATHAIEQDSVACPTCGAGYNNNFGQRFELVEDTDRLTDYLAELTARVEKMDVTISVFRKQFSNNTDEATRVRRILQTRQGEVTLESMLQAQGRREVRKGLSDKLNAGMSFLHEQEGKEAYLSAKLRDNAREASERRGEILREYEYRLRSNLTDLNVQKIQGAILKDPAAPLRESGSDLPRALVAYYYAVLHVMSKSSPSAFCPIVIDSPNQQDQDKDNLVALLSFIRDHQPPKSQVILGVADSYGVQFEGTVVDLHSKHHLLQPGDYSTSAEEVMSLTEQALDYHRRTADRQDQDLLL